MMENPSGVLLHAVSLNLEFSVQYRPERNCRAADGKWIRTGSMDPCGGETWRTGHMID